MLLHVDMGIVEHVVHQNFLTTHTGHFSPPIRNFYEPLSHRRICLENSLVTSSIITRRQMTSANSLRNMHVESSHLNGKKIKQRADVPRK